MRELLRQRLVRMSEKEISVNFSISISEINAIKAVSLLSSIMVKTSSTLKDERYLS